MSRSPRVVVVGSSNTDLVIKTQSIPRPGETVLGGSFLMAAGGKGANQAVAAARLGADVTFIARIGSDAFGDAARACLAAEGIRTEFIEREDQTASGVALIIVDEQAENAIAVAPGANSLLSANDVERANDTIRAADVLLLQLETPLDTVRHAARLAREARVPVILNPAPAQPLDCALLEDITVLTPNRGEAAFLSGIEVGDEATARAAANALLEMGVAHVVITLGAEGALWIGRGEGEREEDRVAGMAVEAIDTTAAGDAFNGALAAALGAGDSMREAVRFATVAGALATTQMGAQPSLPTREAVEILNARAQ
ncbi:MAG: ribokinase [Gemmatimonadales bacterium]|nr:ribokinase [Gemmatimonadales bacterium]